MIEDIFRLSLDLKSAFNERIKPFDLTFQQWLILKTINKTESITSNKICEEIRSDKGTVSILLKKLENKKMIEIKVNPGDRRQKIVTISEEMHDKCKQIQKIEQEFYQEIFKGITEKEKSKMQSLCKVMTNNLI